MSVSTPYRQQYSSPAPGYSYPFSGRRMSHFKQLSQGQIGVNRFLVVSVRDTDGRFSIAQQVKAETETSPIEVYMKHAITVDIDGLKAARDVIDEALRALEGDDAAEVEPQS